MVIGSVHLDLHFAGSRLALEIAELVRNGHSPESRRWTANANIPLWPWPRDKEKKSALVLKLPSLLKEHVLFEHSPLQSSEMLA